MDMIVREGNCLDLQINILVIKQIVNLCYMTGSEHCNSLVPFFAYFPPAKKRSRK